MPERKAEEEVLIMVPLDELQEVADVMCDVIKQLRGVVQDQEPTALRVLTLCLTDEE